MKTWTPVFHKGRRKFSRRLRMALGQRSAVWGCTFSPLDSGQVCGRYLRASQHQCLSETWQSVAFLGLFKSHFISCVPRCLLAEPGRKDVLSPLILPQCVTWLQGRWLSGLGGIEQEQEQVLIFLWFICQRREDRFPPGHQECHLALWRSRPWLPLYSFMNGWGCRHTFGCL